MRANSAVGSILTVGVAMPVPVAIVVVATTVCVAVVRVATRAVIGVRVGCSKQGRQKASRTVSASLRHSVARRSAAACSTPGAQIITLVQRHAQLTEAVGVVFSALPQPHCAVAALATASTSGGTRSAGGWRTVSVLLALLAPVPVPVPVPVTVTVTVTVALLIVCHPFVSRRPHLRCSWPQLRPPQNPQTPPRALTTHESTIRLLDKPAVV